MPANVHKGRLVSIALFILISSVIVLTGNHYKEHKLRQARIQEYRYLTQSMSSEVETLIDEKKNASLAIAMALAENEHLIDKLHDDARQALQRFSQQLREETDFKNVWVQLVDAAGVSRARSWSDTTGDNLANIRGDVRDMLRNPRIRSTISVGHFDMSFKSMVPIQRDGEFLGFLELITHFNSIARQLEAKGFRVAILLDTRYRKQLTHPFSGKFVGEHYVANKDADPELLDHIGRRGLESLIDTHTNHVVDSGLNALVINYPLFDTDDQPMANFLLFLSLDRLQTDPVGEIRTSINLLMLLAIGIVGVILYLIDIHGIPSDTGKGVAYKGLSALGFIVLVVFYVGLLHLYRQSKQADFLAVYNQQLLSEYQIVQNKFDSIAELVFQTILNRPDILSLVAQAYAGAKQKNRARRLLLDRLSQEYGYLRHYDLRQLHFHLRNNESFLRFHRPGKFGDNLTGVRSTVAWVNANHIPIAGFEEGRIYNGFRFVFPLFTVDEQRDKQHIGSVETSFSAHALLNELISGKQARGGFLIREEVVEHKVFAQEKVNYSASAFPGFLKENSIGKQLDHRFKHMDSRLLSPEQTRLAAERILQGDIFTLGTADNRSLFSFIPLKNPVSQKVVGALVVQMQHPFLDNQESSFLLLLVAGIISILLLVLYLYRELSSKARIHGLLKKTQKILDAQQSMVIITNGHKLLDCNRKVLDFFGYDSLEEFTRDQVCICDRFIENDRFFHLGKVPEGVIWVRELEENPDKEYIVAMADAYDEQHAFALSLSRFDRDYIVTFLDISDTISEHFYLEEKVLHDELTGALNRNYFHNNIHRLMEEAHAHGQQLGLIMFDVDHFKQINDSFGHARGDQVLIRLVENVKAGIRGGDALIRWGGEEFLLLVKTPSLQSLESMAEHIRIRLEEESHPQAGRVTCSFGQALYREGEAVEQTIQRVDRALYQAKDRGRNRVVSLD